MYHLPIAASPLATIPHAMVQVGRTTLAVARESRALMVQSTLMPRDLGWTVPSSIDRGQRVVVLVHGLFATAGALRILRQRIETATGHRTASFSYEPGCDLVTLVDRLRQLLDTLPASCPIDLVGHSLGGLAARYYVQVGLGDDRIRQTISLASPFQGSELARYLPSYFCRDLTPDSPALRLLHQHHVRAAHVPHTSIASTHDQLVRPWQNAVYPHGRRIVVTARGHNTLLFDGTVADHVTQRLARVPPTMPSMSATRTTAPNEASARELTSQSLAPPDHGLASPHRQAYAFASNHRETA